MPTAKDWIGSFRLRTLPLAMSCILIGSFAQYNAQYFRLEICILCIVTTILLQILSNLANDYGDGMKGTDNKNRLGPQRAIQSNTIRPSAMKKAIVLLGSIAFIAGGLLIYLSLKTAAWPIVLSFTGLGIAAIIAAIKYTMGKNPYGYSGWGDFFVFLFFGIVGVSGSHYLQYLNFHGTVLLLATCIGLLSVAVLNLNNMRDIENDKASGKMTIVVKLGSKKAKGYHTFLILMAFASLITYLILQNGGWLTFLPLLAFPLFLANLSVVWRNKSPKALDGELKKVALGTFATSLLYVISVLF